MKNIYFILLLISLTACNENKVPESAKISITDTLISTQKSQISVLSEEQNDPERIKIYSELKSQCESKGVNFCDLYQRFKVLTNESSKKAQTLYPTDNEKFLKYGDEYFNKKSHILLYKDGLPDSLDKSIMIYGDIFCK